MPLSSLAAPRPSTSVAFAHLILPVLLGWLFGVALQLQQATRASPELTLACGLLAMVLLFVLHGVRRASLSLFNQRTRLQLALQWGLVFLAMLLTGWASTQWRASRFEAQALSPDLQGKDLVLTGRVAAMPQRSEAGLRFRFDVDSAQYQGQAVNVPPSIYLGWYSGRGASATPLVNDDPASDETAEAGGRPPAKSSDLVAGQQWRLTARLKAPHGASNPHGYDFELWLWEQGLQATGYVRDGPRDATPTLLQSTWQHPLEQARQRVRDAIFLQLVPSDQAGSERARWAGVVAALVVGDQQAIDRADWDVFRATGVAHLMSISGLHVTMFAWLSAMGLAWLWRRSTRLCLSFPAQNAGLWGGLVLALLYALFSGWGVPAQRTIGMLATASALRAVGKHWPWPLVWLFICAVVVAWDPWALLQAGFWLSFVAVGILFASATGENNAVSASRGWRARVRAFFREQGVITLALAPLTLLLFGQVSIIGLVANAAAIPWVTAVITPLSMAGVVYAPLWNCAAWAVQALAWVLAQGAALSWATLSVAQAPLWAGFAGVCGGVLLVMPLPWRLRLLGLPLILPVLLWQAPRPDAGEFELLAVDIGQGNAVLVQTATHALLYDAGPSYSRESDAGHRTLVPLLRALDVHLDTVMLSHRDSDHTGGAPAVLAMQPQAQLISSIEDSHPLQAQRPAQRCLAGQHWVWDGVHFEVLHPRAEHYDAGQKSNAMSCVLRVRNGRSTVLLVGDIERPQEAQLLAADAPLKADVLLVPHHGSKTSSSPPFVDAVSPTLALVQAGYRNRFGHPAPVVLERYAERGIRVVDSAHCGAAHWQSMAPDRVSCQRESGQRYWQHRLNNAISTHAHSE